MGHCIRAVIGIHETIEKLSDAWGLAEEIVLPQGYGMVLVTDAFLDDLEELYDGSEEPYPEEFDFFTEALGRLLEQYSFRAKLVYVETDYFGGVGTQAGVFYKDGKIGLGPQKGAGSINRMLRALGVWCVPGKDEFDSLALGRHRRMPV